MLCIVCYLGMFWCEWVGLLVELGAGYLFLCDFVGCVVYCLGLCGMWRWLVIYGGDVVCSIGVGVVWYDIFVLLQVSL